MGIQSLILILFIIGNAILSLIIYRNNPKSSTNKLFTFLIILLTLYLTVNTNLYLFDSEIIKLFLSRFIISLGALINYAVFMFLLTFPKNKISLKKKYFLPLIISTILLFWAGFTNLIFSNIIIENNVIIPVPGLLMPIFLIHTVLLLGGGIVASLLRFRKSKGIEKVKIRFIILSFISLFSLIFILNFILAVFFQNGSFVPFLPIYILIFNMMITYSIVRHRLLDIKILVARAVTYTLLLFSLISIYALIVFGFAKLLPDWINSDYVFIMMAIIVSFSFNFIQNILEKATYKIFFRGHYETEKLLSQLTNIMATEIVFQSLGKKLLKNLTKEMRLSSGAFVLIHNNEVQNIEQLNFKKEVLINEQLNSLLKDKKDTFIFEELVNKEIKDLFIKLNISAVLSLKVKNKNIGLLVLGPKSSGDIYSNQDLELLEIFAPQAAIALQNAQSYRKIQSFSRTLEKKVKERTTQLVETQKRELSKAKQLLKIKDEFVFIATHDLGTPVTAIKGFISLVEDDKSKLSKNHQESFSAIKQASDRLSELTNDLLQVARSESGAIKIKTQQVDIIELIEKTVKQTSAHASENKIKLNTKLHAKKCIVLADEEKLYEVMENLLSNAIKYNKDKGMVTVTSETNKDKLQIDVIDNGIGIPKEHHHKVFQKFSRIHQDGTENITGTGLGLFVVRMMIEKMKGKISFTSVKDKGTTFSFILPLAKSQSLKKTNN